MQIRAQTPTHNPKTTRLTDQVKRIARLPCFPYRRYAGDIEYTIHCAIYLCWWIVTKRVVTTDETQWVTVRLTPSMNTTKRMITLSAIVIELQGPIRS